VNALTGSVSVLKRFEVMVKKMVKVLLKGSEVGRQGLDAILQHSNLGTLKTLNTRTVFSVLLQEMNCSFNNTRIIEERNPILEKKQK
jgi:hypothetical protein